MITSSPKSKVRNFRNGDGIPFPCKYSITIQGRFPENMAMLFEQWRKMSWVVYLRAKAYDRQVFQGKTRIAEVRMDHFTIVSEAWVHHKFKYSDVEAVYIP